MTSIRSDQFLIAIPVFNEKRYVTGVLHKVLQYCDNVLVVDDGSTDATPRLLREFPGVHVITHPVNRGYGKSLSDAFRFAERHGYRWLITMDCDEQHEPDRIPDFQAAALRDDADIISGTRYPQGQMVEASVPADRREINRRITNLLNDRLGLNLTDAFCGFKAYRVSALRCLNVTVPGYAMPMQLWAQASFAGLRIEELPVRLIYNDPTRHFGGLLDDPSVRLAHYLDVFESEMARQTARRRQAASTPCVPCR